uniref:DUF6533 domain-containing protein n=1 Tax=Moniliophthora roreri TaxID=221103 RepID=A0A0W0ETV2_MONRR
MASKAAKDAATHYLQFDIQWSSIALLFYDYALTFPMEVKYMWGTKPRLSTALYILCRYALVANVLYLLAIAKKLGSRVRILYCDTWYKIIGALSVFGRGAVIGRDAPSFLTFSARTYAIFGRNRWILAYLSLLGLACVALDIMHVPGLRCVGSSSIPIGRKLIYSATEQAFRVNGAWRTQKGGFLYMIFEQGILYFSVISLFTTAAVVLNYRAPAGFFQRLLNALTLPLSGLLTARFLLHLRKWEYKQKNLGISSQGSPNSGTATMGSFRAAPGRGQSTVLSTIIEDFGEDPVAIASSSKGAGLTNMKQRSEVAQTYEDTSSATGSGPSSSSHDLGSSVKEGKKPVINVGSVV